jgi:hypothetical protein
LRQSALGSHSTLQSNGQIGKDQHLNPTLRWAKTTLPLSETGNPCGLTESVEIGMISTLKESLPTLADRKDSPRYRKLPKRNGEPGFDTRPGHPDRRREPSLPRGEPVTGFPVEPEYPLLAKQDPGRQSLAQPALRPTNRESAMQSAVAREPDSITLRPPCGNAPGTRLSPKAQERRIHWRAGLHLPNP